MNTQLIDDLAAQACAHSKYASGGYVFPVYELVELVVKECAKRSGELRHVYPHQAELTKASILKHFGMEDTP